MELTLKRMRRSHGNESNLLLLFLAHVLNHFFHHLLTLVFPQLAILEGILQRFVAAKAKDTAVFELFRQRNDVVIKEACRTIG